MNFITLLWRVLSPVIPIFCFPERPLFVHLCQLHLQSLNHPVKGYNLAELNEPCL